MHFTIPDAYSALVDIEGYTFHVDHGGFIKSFSGIPFYGIERKTRRLAALHNSAGRNINYFCIGHFHTLSTMPSPGGEVIINGSFKKTDPYALNELGVAGEPMQLLHGVHKDHGVSWRLPVKLAFKGDTRGPKRYKIDFK